MYCQKCGTQLPDDSIFCNKCGYSVKSVVSPNVTTIQSPTLHSLGIIFTVIGGFALIILAFGTLCFDWMLEDFTSYMIMDAMAFGLLFLGFLMMGIGKKR